MASTVWAQPGTVHHFQKISDTEGNFPAILTSSEELGAAVARLGDLDGPGPSQAALAVGASHDDDGGMNRGAVFIMFLTDSGKVSSYQKISDIAGNFTATLENSDEVGGSIAWLGDLDGAGPSTAAIAVGSTGDDDGGLDRGCVYIMFLNSSGTVLSHVKISDTEGNFNEALPDTGQFGDRVAFLGDLDGDGPSVAALAVGASGDDDGGRDRGAVYIMFLDEAGAILSHQKISDVAGNFTATIDDADEFGSSLAFLGDLDGAGPGVSAMAVGAIGDDDGSSNRGCMYILFLAPDGTVVSHQKISSTQGNFTEALSSSDEMGGSASYAGDIDGPGGSAVSLVVGATHDDDGGTDRGCVYVMFLAPNGTVMASQKISGLFGNFSGALSNDDDFGTSATSLGDLDGAGPSVQAIVVGAIGDDDGGSDRGCVWVMFLNGTPTANVPWTPIESTVALGLARPNPFRAGTSMMFRLPEAAHVRIDVVDLQGRIVRELRNESAAAGEHETMWDGRDDARRALAPGAYLLRLSVNGRVTASRKAVLLN